MRLNKKSRPDQGKRLNLIKTIESIAYREPDVKDR